jgi:hypothetical protein
MRFMAAAGLPAFAVFVDVDFGDLRLLTLLVAMLMADLIQLDTAVERDSSSNPASSSSSRDTSSNAAKQLQGQAMQQLVEALPFPEVLLLLLEHLLLDPFESPYTFDVKETMLDALHRTKGAAASAAAAAALLPPLLTQLPAAVLCAAAAVGCPGCNPQPAASSGDVKDVQKMHSKFALFVRFVAMKAAAAPEGKLMC